ncbi:MAG: hypothetical protein IT353_21215 [Gemmatimonadaceae bacterium]|nr:hypothetical protein [Gemmatimonadaceae bacterium]
MSFRVSRSIRSATALATFVVAATVAVAQTVADVTGKWAFAVVTENGTGTPTVVLKQEGEKLTGTYESARMGVRNIEGSIKKDSLRFALKGGEVELTFVGVVVDKDNLKGILDMGGQGNASFTAVRQQ